MNLKKQYQRLFEGRQAFAKANTLKTGDSLLEYTPGDRYGGQDGDAAMNDMDSEIDFRTPEPFDIEYYSDQLNTILESIDDYHQELGTNIEKKAQETGNYKLDAAEKQVSRYINVATKGLEDLQKYLERQKGNL